MKISIFAPTEWQDAIQNMIATENRLHELVSIHYLPAEHIPSAASSLVVNDTTINLMPDWYNELAPVLYPTDIPFDQHTLLGLIFARLGNYERAGHYLSADPALLFCTDLVNRLENRVVFSNNLLEAFESLSHISPALAAHNLAIAYHYGDWERMVSFETIANLYEQAMVNAADHFPASFTANHYATLLADAGQLDESPDTDARYGLQITLCSVWMGRLTVPYDTNLQEQLKAMLWDNLQYLEQSRRVTGEAMLLVDAAHIANISNSFSESLGYITKAIQIFQREEQPELEANAQLKKGILLYTWAQSGQIQFYKGAMDALLAALHVFKREEAPDVFADIHHYLGIIYSEIPDEVKKKSIWAAVSVSSFNEALNFYNKIDYPYEFGMICNNMGNAYTRFPAALHSDNYDKALAWYREALDVRTAGQYPLERCNTLYNYGSV
jgi:tetratricopeptide (TPR) repeat protein